MNWLMSPFSHTWRCRILLLLAPVLFPLDLLIGVMVALVAGAKGFGEAMKEWSLDSWHTWYRHVYRPARYGHVRDAK